MTKRHLQRELVGLWARVGIPVAEDERAMLLGWEVMLPSWKINDARRERVIRIWIATTWDDPRVCGECCRSALADRVLHGMTPACAGNVLPD